ncbi:MAG: acetolactate synthase small subunit [Alcanivoracaceae bacterium]|nr:acetolactate synthase small subunit [Alcanivoracaceae bacterium]
MTHEFKKKYTLALFSRNRAGILNRITSVFSRIKLNIDSLNVSETESKGVFRYSVNVNTTENLIKRITKQIEKQVDVIKAVYATDEYIVQQEVALYKIPSSVMLDHIETEKIIRDHHARILTMHRDYTVIEKTGHQHETQKLFDVLEPYGILEFVRSGPISISKTMQQFSDLNTANETNTYY